MIPINCGPIYFSQFKDFSILLNKNLLLCYSLRWSLLTSRFHSDFPLIPALYAKPPAFYADIFLCISLCRQHTWLDLCRLPSVCGQRERVRDALTRGGRAGSRRWRKILRGCAHKTILAQNLLRQSEAWSQLSVRFLVTQGIREARSADHVGVRPRDCNFNMTIEPSMYVWKGFLNCFRHESTQIHEYEKGLIT